MGYLTKFEDIILRKRKQAIKAITTSQWRCDNVERFIETVRYHILEGSFVRCSRYLVMKNKYLAFLTIILWYISVIPRSSAQVMEGHVPALFQNDWCYLRRSAQLWQVRTFFAKLVSSGESVARKGRWSIQLRACAVWNFGGAPFVEWASTDVRT